MADWLRPSAVGEALETRLPGVVAESTAFALYVRPERLLEVAQQLHDDPEWDFDQLSMVTAADYIDYFEVIYLLQSIGKNQALFLKAKVPDRRAPSVSSLYPVYKGANLQEREVWDMFGIHFEGHPNLKRLLTWEGF